MPPRNLPQSPAGRENSDDPATAAILAGGCADGVPSFAVGCWISHGSPAMPVFIAWLLGIGRSCLAVKYGRYSLRGRDWFVDTGAGLRSTQSPLDQARLEVMRVSHVPQVRLMRSVPVSAALTLPGMVRDRRIRAHGPPEPRPPVPPLWDLERYTATLAGLEADAHCSQPPERPQALEEISALM